MFLFNQMKTLSLRALPSPQWVRQFPACSCLSRNTGCCGGYPLCGSEIRETRQSRDLGIPAPLAAAAPLLAAQRVLRQVWRDGQTMPSLTWEGMSLWAGRRDVAVEPVTGVRAAVGSGEQWLSGAGENTALPLSFGSLPRTPQSLRKFLASAPQDTSVVFWHLCQSW